MGPEIELMCEERKQIPGQYDRRTRYETVRKTKRRLSASAMRFGDYVAEDVRGAFAAGAVHVAVGHKTDGKWSSV